MPCTYTGSLQGDQIYGLEKVVKSQRKELDKLTRMLCALCGELNNSGWTDCDFRDTSEELADWWKQHQEDDEERALYERLKKKYG